MLKLCAFLFSVRLTPPARADVLFAARCPAVRGCPGLRRKASGAVGPIPVVQSTEPGGPGSPCPRGGPRPGPAVPRGSAGAAAASFGGGSGSAGRPSRHELLAGRHGRPQRRPAALRSRHGERGTRPAWGRAGRPRQPWPGPPCGRRLRRCR